MGKLSDDKLGRALDRLFHADRGTLLTEVVVAATKRFDLDLSELHNDSTSISFSGQYRGAEERKDRRISGKRAPWITYGYSKDHRPDLKQLLFILTTTRDGGVPVQFRCEDGNTNDSATHMETWEALVRAAGTADFLYVADSKLCVTETMKAIDHKRGRFLTVLPRARMEDKEFREWIHTHEPDWELVRDLPHPRRKGGVRDRWFAFRYPLPSQEGWPVIWLWSTLSELHTAKRRRERLAKAAEQLAELDQRLQGPRTRPRSWYKVQDRVAEILKNNRVVRYLDVEVWKEEEQRFHQERRGRAGAKTRYKRETKERWRVRWTVDEEVVAFDQKSDGMYPILTNDRSLSLAAVLEVHKRQPVIEKRFEQYKSIHEIAPVMLKNEGRIEALFFIYFLAMMVQALIERELRGAMGQKEIKELALYPEQRTSKRPTYTQVMRLFSMTSGQLLMKDGTVVQAFQPELTELQAQTLELLGVPEGAFKL